MLSYSCLLLLGELMDGKFVILSLLFVFLMANLGTLLMHLGSCIGLLVWVYVCVCVSMQIGHGAYLCCEQKFT